MSAVRYVLEPRGSRTAVLRIGPKGGRRLIEVYSNYPTAAAIRDALQRESGSVIHGR